MAEQETPGANEETASPDMSSESAPAGDGDGAGATGAGEEQAKAEAPVGPISMLSLAVSGLLQERDQTRDRLLRTAAEFDNYKKRSKRDATESVRRAEDRVVQEFLPVIDNLERALAHAEGESETVALLDGVRMVHKQFLSTLERYEIKPFDSVGQPFNPELHEAIQQMTSDQPAGSVCHELQRGYLRGERLVRPALVVVSKGPGEAPASEDGAPADDEPLNDETTETEKGSETERS
jgi:molecular chaperone GrpE